MKKSFALILTIVASGTAAAQPAEPPPEGGEGAPPPVNPPRPPPPRPVARPPAPAPVYNEGRPEELAFGIGVGYQFPTSLQSPNLTSVRMRLTNGLTLEPQLVFANSSDDIDLGMGMTATDSTTEVGIGTAARWPLITNGKLDFELVGGVGIRNVKNNPDGPNNNTKTTTLGLTWGIGIAYWLSPHWNLSLTASNPLTSYTTTTREIAPGLRTTDSTTEIGVIFEPRVALMIHLFN